MMIGLLLWHRAAEDRLVLLVHHWPRPVAAVQHTHMSGACAELGTTTSPATPAFASSPTIRCLLRQGWLVRLLALLQRDLLLASARRE